MKAFRDLAVWEKAHSLTMKVYRLTRGFPNEERYGLTSQLRRSASSIPCNIAEGCGRNSDADLARFLDIAMGSASETEYQLLLVHDLEYISTPDYEVLNNEIEEIKRMLAGFIKKLRQHKAES